MSKAPPRETVGRMTCTNRHCSETATVKKDAGGFLFLSCPNCRTINNRAESYQRAVREGMAAYKEPEPPAPIGEKPIEQPPIEQPPIEKSPIENPPRKSLFGGLAIFQP
jgi:uncharacterized C2H2 Zn-finger protein